MKSGNEGIFKDEGKFDVVIEQGKIVKKVLTSIMANVQWVVIL